MLIVKESFDLLTSLIIFLFKFVPFEIHIFSRFFAFVNHPLHEFAVLFNSILCVILINLDLIIPNNLASTHWSSCPFTQLYACPHLFLRCWFHFLFESWERTWNRHFLIIINISDFEAHLSLDGLDFIGLHLTNWTEFWLLTLGGHFWSLGKTTSLRLCWWFKSSWIWRDYRIFTSTSFVVIIDTGVHHVFVKLVLILSTQCVSCIRHHLFVAHQCLVIISGLASFTGYFLSRWTFAFSIIFFMFDTTFVFSLFLAIVPAAVGPFMLFLSYFLRFFPGPRSPLVLLHINNAICSLKICWFVFWSLTPFLSWF